MNTQNTIKEIQKDIRNLKLKAFQPDKEYARLLFKNSTYKDLLENKLVKEIWKKDIELLNEWFEIYCKEHDCTKEEALERVIEE